MDKFVSERLTKLCAEKGMSVYQLASKSGISTSSLYYIFQGRTSPRVSTLQILCESLGITIEEFFYGFKDGNDAETEAEELETMLRSLTAANRKFLKEFLELLLRLQNGEYT